MSRSVAIVVGVVAAFVCGALAYGAQADAAGWIKCIVVGLTSGAVVTLFALALDDLAYAADSADDYTEDLGRRVLETRTLKSLESTVQKRGNLPGVAERSARQLAGQLRRSVTFARWAAGVCIYIGIGGTLLGLVFAALGRKALESNPFLLVWGFGGTFTSAMFGVVATFYLMLRIASFDGRVQEVEEMAENHVNEVIFQSAFSSEDRLSQLIATAVGQSFSQVGEVWSSFSATAKKIEAASETISIAAAQMNTAADRLAAHGEVADGISRQLASVSVEANTTALACADSAKQLHEVAIELFPVFRAVKTGIETLDQSLANIYPALESARDLQLTIRAADRVFKNIDSRLAGMAAAIQDEARQAGDRMVTSQQNIMAEGITPPLKSIARAMDLLILLIDRSDQLLRNLPLAAPAARIVDDLKSASAEQLAGAERDARTVEAAMQRLDVAETKMTDIIRELRAAHAQIAQSMKELQGEASAVIHNMVEFSEYIDQPFWKKLGQ